MSGHVRELGSQDLISFGKVPAKIKQQQHATVFDAEHQAYIRGHAATYSKFDAGGSDSKELHGTRYCKPTATTPTRSGTLQPKVHVTDAGAFVRLEYAGSTADGPLSAPMLTC